MNTLERRYPDPLSVDPTWLCLLNLAFAIGLVLATPSLGSYEDIVINKLKKERHRSCIDFYLNARSQQDPIVGFEDAGFWCIQALLPMAVCMLTMSKRNTASAYFGRHHSSVFASVGTTVVVSSRHGCTLGLCSWFAPLRRDNGHLFTGRARSTTELLAVVVRDGSLSFGITWTANCYLRRRLLWRRPKTSRDTLIPHARCLQLH